MIHVIMPVQYAIDIYNNCRRQ